jgi:hypothetical protein
MKITLSLYEDPYGEGEPASVKANMWTMQLNGQDFPNEKDCLMTLKMAKEITERLIEIRELDFDEDLF